MVVIFEQSNDYQKANNKDCAVMVNGFDATFKNVTINEDGITLVPLNLNNQDHYSPTFYNKEQVEKLPVRIIGIAREKRTRLWKDKLEHLRFVKVDEYAQKLYELRKEKGLDYEKIK